MSGRENGEGSTGAFGGPNPLIRIQLLGIEYLMIGNRIDAVDLLALAIRIENMQIVRNQHPHLGPLPRELPLVGNREHWTIGTIGMVSIIPRQIDFPSRIYSPTLARVSTSISRSRPS